MSSERNKDLSQENRERVRGVLNEHWDPLGVADQVNDEYDNQVDRHQLMDQRVSESAISRYLYLIATTRMWLTPYPPFGRRLRKDSGHFGCA